MIIIGAGGLAKEIFQILSEGDEYKEISFFDDFNFNVDTLFGKKIHQNLKSLLKLKNTDDQFIIGFGDLKLKKKFTENLLNEGFVNPKILSKHSYIGNCDVEIGDGTVIMANACISNSVTLGRGCLAYYSSVITHDCIIGDYTTLSPGVKVLGRVSIGENCLIGANATILPDVTIGSNVIVGAGAVVDKNVMEGTIVAGVPAKLLPKKL